MSPQELVQVIERLIAETLREFEQGTGMRVQSVNIYRGLSIDQSHAGRITSVGVEIGEPLQ